MVIYFQFIRYLVFFSAFWWFYCWGSEKSKDFRRFWHNALISKFTSFGIYLYSFNLLSDLHSYCSVATAVNCHFGIPLSENSVLFSISIFHRDFLFVILTSILFFANLYFFSYFNHNKLIKMEIIKLLTSGVFNWEKGSILFSMP